MLLCRNSGFRIRLTMMWPSRSSATTRT
jgi:hypothetical protein